LLRSRDGGGGSGPDRRAARDRGPARGRRHSRRAGQGGQGGGQGEAVV